MLAGEFANGLDTLLWKRSLPTSEDRCDEVEDVAPMLNSEDVAGVATRNAQPEGKL